VHCNKFVTALAASDHLGSSILRTPIIREDCGETKIASEPEALVDFFGSLDAEVYKAAVL